MINWKECNPLSDQELHETACQAKEGDPKAIEKLVQSNIKLASKLANQYTDFDGINTEDLTSEALIGLIEAIPLYDPDRGTKFTTYASWRMRMHVLNFVMENFSLIKIGTTVAQKKIFWRLNRETEAIRKAGFEVNEHTLADRLQVKPEEIKDMQIRMNHSESSLQAVNPHNKDGLTLLDTLDNNDPNPEEYTTYKTMTAWVQARMVEFEQRLTDTDLFVWNYRIASDKPVALQDLGEQLGVTRQRINQIEIKLHEAFIKYAQNKANGY